MDNIYTQMATGVNSKSNNQEITDANILQEFLIQSFSNSDRLYHYTTYESLLNIIGDKSLRLTRLDKLNDKAEVKMGDERDMRQYYVISFTDAQESIAMWKMYGKPSGIKLRVDFNTKMFINAISDKHYYKQVKEDSLKDKLLEEKSNGNRTMGGTKKQKYIREYFNQPTLKNFIKTIDTTPPFSKKEVFADIAYIDKKNNKVMHNGQQLQYLSTDIRENRDMKGFLKYSAWDYEKEKRFRIRLDNNKEEPENIYVEITDSLIKDFCITFNPCMSDELKGEIKKSLDTKAHCKLNYTDSIIDG